VTPAAVEGMERVKPRQRRGDGCDCHVGEGHSTQRAQPRKPEPSGWCKDPSGR
jgi:hypothetical protein